MLRRLASTCILAFSVGSCGDGGGGSAPAQAPNDPNTQSFSTNQQSPAIGTLASVGTITIPAAALAAPTNVLIAKTTSATVQEQFETSAAMFGATVRAPFEMTVTLGSAQPTQDVQVTLEVPASVKAAATSNDEVRIFYLNRFTDDDNTEQLDTMELLPTRGNPADPTITASVPREAFQLTSINQYEANLFVGLTPTAPTVQTVLKNIGRKVLAAVSPVTCAWAADGGCAGVSIGRPVDDSIAESSGFGPRNVKNDPNASKFHRGIDYAAPLGTPVKAAAAGTILIVAREKNKQTGALKGWGYYVVVKHTDGGTTLYGHLTEDSATFSVGASVSAGTVIALSGNTGNGKAHLHFEYAPDGKTFQADGRVDPKPCIEKLAVGSLTVRDNGAAADDAFSLSLGNKEICRTAIGQANSCALGALRPGKYSLELTVIVAPDDVGTYEITVNDPLTTINGGKQVSGSPPQGTKVSFELVVATSTPQ